MNYSAIYILIALVDQAAIAFLFFLIKPAAQQKKLFLPASLSFAFNAGGILFGEEKMIRPVANLNQERWRRVFKAGAAGPDQYRNSNLFFRPGE